MAKRQKNKILYCYKCELSEQVPAFYKRSQNLNFVSVIIMNWERETLHKISQLGIADLNTKDSVSDISRDEIHQIFGQLLNTYNQKSVISDYSDLQEIGRFVHHKSYVNIRRFLKVVGLGHIVKPNASHLSPAKDRQKIFVALATLVDKIEEKLGSSIFATKTIEVIRLINSYIYAIIETEKDLNSKEISIETISFEGYDQLTYFYFTRSDETRQIWR